MGLVFYIAMGSTVFLLVALLLAPVLLRLPVPVLQQLRSARVHGAPMRDALRTAVKHLREYDVPLDESDTAVFETVLDATSTEASDAFDRVMTR